jgi:cytochrome P450
MEDNPDQLTDKDIREEVDTFLFEGHDTTSISITMTLVLLGMHPDIQVRYCVLFTRRCLHTKLILGQSQG